MAVGGSGLWSNQCRLATVRSGFQGLVLVNGDVRSEWPSLGSFILPSAPTLRTAIPKVLIAYSHGQLEELIANYLELGFFGLQSDCLPKSVSFLTSLVFPSLLIYFPPPPNN